MVKTSVSFRIDDLERARELGINVWSWRGRRCVAGSRARHSMSRSRARRQRSRSGTSPTTTSSSVTASTRSDHRDAARRRRPGRLRTGRRVGGQQGPARGARGERRFSTAVRHERGVVTVVPVTSNQPVRGGMHVARRPTRLNGLRAPSKAQVEQIRSLDVTRVRALLGRLGPSDVETTDEALRYHLAL